MIRKHFVRITLCLAIVAMNYGANAQDETSINENSRILNALLDEKLKFYRHLYPDITFLILNGGEEWVAEMMSLDIILGFQPTSLDYEHPPELREDLMIASANRILLMLKSRAPSASLFLADEPVDWQAHVCVLTINPDEVASDSIQATRHLSDLPEELMQKVAEDMRIQAADYLAFVIDHEVYHCLKSKYVGPQIMSSLEFWGEYSHYLGEQGADAYALAMHVKNQGKVSSFARNIKRIRGLSLYSADPDHMTCKALEQVIKTPVKDIATMGDKEIFDMANRIKADLTITYDEYILYLASAVQAMKELGLSTLITEELRNRINNTQGDRALIKELVSNSRRCLAEMSGDAVE